MNEIVEYETESGKVELTAEIIKNHLAIGKGFTDKEIIAFLNLCRYQKLNPFLKEAYLIKYGDSAQMVVGKDVFVKRAEKHEKFKGYKAGIIVEKDGKIEMRDGTFYLKGKESLVGGWAEVYRSDREIPLKHTVAFDEFSKNQSTWKSMPATMIRKVALVQALRETFPENFQGLYDSYEMSIEVLEDTKITKEQQKYLFHIATEENVKKALEHFGYSGTHAIPVAEYSVFTKYLMQPDEEDEETEEEIEKQ